MLDQNLIKELINKISQDILNNLNSQNNNLELFKQDLSKSIKLALEKVFKDLDLVTRQEFDIQTQVLADAENKLQKLHNKLIELENKK